jgi:GMP synthase PP-ATPase subunit
MLWSMGLSLTAVSSTCVEHQNTDVQEIGSKHNNGGVHLADNAHLAIVKTLIKLNAKNKVERAGLYAELAATLPDLSEHG